MGTLRLGSGQVLQVGELLNSGGYGELFSVVSPSTDLVFKRLSDETLKNDPSFGARIDAMLRSPPKGVVDGRGHVAVAWPTDAVRERGRIVGFVMPRIDVSRSVELHTVANPTDRPRPEAGFANGFTWEYMVASARNLAHAVAALHAAGVVVGDFNERNMLVHEDARVSLVDCDSMQVSDPGTGRSFLCEVGRPEFTPPELQRADWKTTKRAPSSDLYALAIHIHQLLLEGEHPFRGLWQGGGEKPSVSTLARDGIWAHAGDPRLSPRPSAIDIGILPASTIDLFRRAFVEGATNSRRRPTAQKWYENLTALSRSLVTCPDKPQHVYANLHNRCPWCNHEASASTQSALRPARVPPRSPSPAPRPMTPRPSPVPTPVVRSNSAPQSSARATAPPSAPTASRATSTSWHSRPSTRRAALVLSVLGVLIYAGNALMTDDVPQTAASLPTDPLDDQASDEDSGRPAEGEALDRDAPDEESDQDPTGTGEAEQPTDPEPTETPESDEPANPNPDDVQESTAATASESIALTEIAITPSEVLGTSTYSAEYRAQVTSIDRTGTHTIAVAFDATGRSDLRRPDGSCLQNEDTGALARPVASETRVSDSGRYVGTLTFPVLESGRWSFQYSCSGYSLVPVADVAITGPGVSRYSDQYYALVAGFERTGSRIIVEFVAHGRSDLRRPQQSCLSDGSETIGPVSTNLSVDESGYVVGTLEFQTTSGGPNLFRYSCRGYSEVELA